MWAYYVNNDVSCDLLFVHEAENEAVEVMHMVMSSLSVMKGDSVIVDDVSYLLENMTARCRTSADPGHRSYRTTAPQTAVDLVISR